MNSKLRPRQKPRKLLNYEIELAVAEKELEEEYGEIDFEVGG